MNVFVVAALAVTGAVFLSGRPRLIRPVLIGFTVLCLADWVLIEDLGFLGGLGTDPNSMIPMVLLAAAGYLAVARAPAEAAEPASSPAAAASWRDRLRIAAAPQTLASASIGSVAAVGAIGVIILGAAPMAAAQASPVADTILAQAIDGSSTPLDSPAPPFSLTDQHGRDVTLASLRGKVVLLTFLDPVCTTDCPLEAQEFRQAGQLLGADDRRVELVAIVANPVDYQLGYTQAFDRQEGLDGVPNWLYLTGSPAQLAQVWHGYGIAAEIAPAGSMIAHSEVAYVIDSARPPPAGNGLRPRPGHGSHPVLVRRRADRRRPPAAEAVMNRPGRRLAATAVLLPAVMLAAGCAGAPATSAPATPAAPPSPALNTSLDTAAGTWAAVVMGGSAAQDNNFWQLFIRPAGSTRWKLVTPPGTADNGGLVLAGGGQALVTGFRPSQDLTYSPLIQTSDGGQAWSSLNPLDAALASAPDALAVKPGSGEMLALLDRGPAEETAPGATTWSTLASPAALAATPAGRRCGLQALTAAAFTPAGLPVLAGTCTRPGTAGIFTPGNGTWQAAGPAIPAALAAQDVTVSRLTRTAQGMTTLLTTGTGSRASLLAAWSAGGSHWTVSPPLPLHGAALASASFGPGTIAAIITSANRGQITTGAGSAWLPLPPLPPGTATLAPGPGGTADALAVHGGTLIVWQYAPGGTAWAKIQVINVPIPYGSSS